MRFHSPEPLPHLPIHPLLAFRYPGTPRHRGLWNQQLPPNFFEREAEFVPLEAADAILLPNNFTRADDEIRAYIRRTADDGEARGIPVFLFAYADFADRLRFDPRVYAFRYSLYGRTAGSRDIMAPTLVEDLGDEGITEKGKDSVPLVTFCGHAGFRTRGAALRYRLKLARYALASLFIPKMAAKKLGVYWRQKAMAACAHSGLIRTHFIVRRSFSGHPDSIELDPATARREYLDTMHEADFVLCPKGDGNYSNRFQEALSMGRLPAYIETDSFLPLEGVASYDRVMVRIPMERVREAPARIRAFYDSLSDEEFRTRQREARALFERYLRPDAFYRYVFTEALPAGTLSRLNR